MTYRAGGARPMAGMPQHVPPQHGTSPWWTLPVIFLLLFRLGSEPSLALDPTWSEVLRWAHVRGLKWGSDIVFTYGPLGFLTPLAAYYPGHDRLFSIAQILLAAGQAGVFALALRAASRWTALAAIAMLVIWSRWIAGDVAWYATYAFAFALVLAGADRAARWQWSTWLLLDVLLAAIALIKFTSAVVFGMWTACLTIWLLWQRRRVDAGVFIAAAVAAWLAMWTACGQTLRGLVDYLRSSLEVAGGYGSAMGLEPERGLQALGIATLLGTVFAVGWIVWKRYPRNTACMAFVFLAALSFIVWRASFTRVDHWPMLFAALSLFPLAALCCDRRSGAERGWSLAAWGVVALSFLTFLIGMPAAPGGILSTAGSSVAQNLRVLHKLRRFERERREQWHALQTSIKLPRIAQMVGSESVDLLMVDQGIVLGLGLDYRPRPVFQSYSAYTPELLRLNEAHFAGAAAPRFVILKLQPIDGRYPMQEDGLALAMLLKRYRPRFTEAGYLLLERSSLDASPITAPPTSAYRELRLGEPIQLPQSDSPLLIFADVQLSWLGRLRAFVLREPALGMNVQTHAGESLNFRLFRRGAQSGFVIAPLLLDARDWTRLPEANADRRAAQVSISPLDSAQIGLFAPEVRIAVVPLGGPFAMEDHSVLEESSAYPGFSQPASDQSAVFDVVEERGHRAVFMHAPSWIEFSLAPGDYRLHGAAGLLERTVTDGGCIAGHADGVMAEASLRELGIPSRSLWQAHIDPFAAPVDGTERMFAIDRLHLSQAATLRIAFAMRSNSTCDWSYLRDLKMEPVP